jgi:hypothetical protein
MISVDLVLKNIIRNLRFLGHLPARYSNEEKLALFKLVAQHLPYSVKDKNLKTEEDAACKLSIKREIGGLEQEIEVLKTGDSQRMLGKYLSGK